VIKLPPKDVPEAITTLYLRLNGFFTSGLVLHSSKKGSVRGDVDCLALRHPFHDQSERGVGSDPLLCLGTTPELLLVEVKSSIPALSFNERLRTDPAALNAFLRWTGLVRPDSLSAATKQLSALIQDGVSVDLAREGTVIDGVRVRALLCCPRCPAKQSVDRWCIRGEQLLDYVNRCLNPHVPRPSCSTTYPLELWGGFLEPLVTYFKKLPLAATPTYSGLHAKVAVSSREHR
jgi:hypothetical protein